MKDKYLNMRIDSFFENKFTDAAAIDIYSFKNELSGAYEAGQQEVLEKLKHLIAFVEEQDKE